MRVLLLLMLSLTAVWAEDAGTRSWPIPGTQLAVVVPTAWTAIREHAGSVLVVRSGLPAGRTGDEAERARGIIAVALQPVKDEGPLAFAVRCRLDLERTATGLQLGKAEDLVLGGRSWTKQPYRMQVGQFTFAQVLYATVIDGTGICITCSSTADGMATWQAEFDAAIASLGRSRLIIDLK
ncbi:MAG: hypothetical protein H0W78_12000 [Planctomycetes bacterium]|nr:hypothetical protein [Planctomycetota bacterium]